ncbi:MAG: NUDIX hydrolase [Nocardioides sp.]|nr:NUDIX hydrolase [Nocardioides sp.]
MSTARRWERVGEQETRYDAGYLRVVRRRLRRPDGAESDWDLLDSVDSVVVLPLTDDGRVVCIEGYRPGPDEVVTCLPGGLVDPGESVLDAARRELLEETGHRAARVEPAGHHQWFKSTEKSWAVVAHGCERVAEQRLEPDEDMHVVLLPVHDVRRRLREGTFGTVPHTYLGLDAAGLL